MPPLFVRVHAPEKERISFQIDGHPAEAQPGDTIMTALLAAGKHLRLGDFGDGHRAGFCLMGACHDCIVLLGDGRRVRACGTYVEPGMNVMTEAPGPFPAGQNPPLGETS